jgi:hypothetical protein
MIKKTALIPHLPAVHGEEVACEWGQKNFEYGVKNTVHKNYILGIHFTQVDKIEKQRLLKIRLFRVKNVN